MTALPQGVASYFETANLALSISRIDAEDDELAMVNDRFTALTGYARDDAIGRNCRFLQGHLRDQPGHAAIRDFLRDPTRIRVRTHLINFTADEKPFVNMLTMTRLTGPGGKARYILASQFDVSAAAPAELLDYAEELRDHIGTHQKSREEREILIGSLHSLGEAAAAIAQARLLMDEADRAGLLTTSD